MGVCVKNRGKTAYVYYTLCNVYDADAARKSPWHVCQWPAALLLIVTQTEFVTRGSDQRQVSSLDI